MRIEIADQCVVALVGASGSGKSTFARKYFKPTEVLSSDFFRGLVSDNENNQHATQAAFDCLYFVAHKRLAAGKLAVIDATHVQPFARKKILDLANAHRLFAVAIVFDIPEKLCIERNIQRLERKVAASVIHSHIQQLKKSLNTLTQEGFRSVYILKEPQDADPVEIVRKSRGGPR